MEILPVNKENLNIQERKCVALEVGMGAMKPNLIRKSTRTHRKYEILFQYNLTGSSRHR